MIESHETKNSTVGENIFDFNNIQAAILHWAKDHRGEFFNSRWQITDPTAFDHFWHDYRDAISLANMRIADKKDHRKPVSVEVLRSEWNIVINSVLPKKALGELQTKLRFTGETNVYVNQIIELMTGLPPSSVETEITATVLKQWLWQVKRKIFGLTVFNHIFLMLYEQKSGAGKSLIVSRICSPLDDWKLAVPLSFVGDERNYKQLGDNFIVVFDEMTRPEKVSADQLKWQITQGSNDYRPLFTNGSVKARQNCSFIGTANKKLDTLIGDDTSMRRFWQIDCQQMDIDVVKNLDCLPLWQSIDENNESGYFVGTIHEMIREEQQKLSTPLPTDLFVDSMNLRPVDAKTAILIGSGVLYRHFQEWCGENGYRLIPDCVRFSKAVGLEKGKIDRSTRGMLINPEHNLEKSQWRRDIL